MEVFVPAESCNGFQLAFNTFVYGYFLFMGSRMISDGSELLLLVPSIAGIVGSIVLPVLGSVPDTLMVLFSGLGPNPAETLAVGVGAIAGSTIMLLTIPWFLSVLGGAVPMDSSGNCVYSKKITSQNGPLGVANSSLVRDNGVFMILSAALYLIIQVPAAICPDQTRRAGIWGAFICAIAFLWYIVNQYRKGSASDSAVSERAAEARASAIHSGELTLLGAMEGLVGPSKKSEGLLESLIDDSEERSRMKSILEPFMSGYEQLSLNSKIGRDEFRIFLHDLRILEFMTDAEVVELFNSADMDQSGHIDLDELVRLMLVVVKRHQHEAREEMPEDLVHLSPSEQQKRIKNSAFFSMFLGTVVVLIFADPAVEVMTEIAFRINVNPFYVSFILAPLASNASEVIASFNYAKKKTAKSIQIALTTLEGAACLNNTFCLAVFLAIVGFRNLEWTFTAEVTAILFVQFAVGAIVLWRQKTFLVSDGYIIVALYPISIALVALLK